MSRHQTLLKNQTNRTDFCFSTNSFCCFSFHSSFGFILLIWPSHVRFTKPLACAIFFLTLFANSTADSSAFRCIGGKYVISQTTAHEVISKKRYFNAESRELFQNASAKRASNLWRVLFIVSRIKTVNNTWLRLDEKLPHFQSSLS